VVVGQFWLLANNLIDSRSARRLLPVIGVAAVVGGVLGGISTSLLVHVIGARQLVLICGLLIVLAMMVVRLLGRHESERTPIPQQEKHRARETIGLIWQSRYLRAISILVSLMFIVDTLVDYQFSVFAKQTYQGPHLTAFLATFQGIYLNLASLAFQLVLTRPVLRHLGVGGALSFAPVGIAAGGVGMLVQPSLLLAAVMKGTEAASRYTFTRTGLELLYLPIPRELNNQTKLFMEVIVDRVSRGAAGAILILLTTVLALATREITLLTLCLLAGWLTAVILAWRSYVAAVRLSIRKREIPLDEAVAVQSNDRATIRVLLQSLDSPNERQVAYSLGLLGQVPRVPLGRRLPQLLHHWSPDVRAATLRLLTIRRDHSAINEAALLLEDAGGIMARDAMHYLCQCGPDPEAKLHEFLQDRRIETRFAAIHVAENYPYSRPIACITESWIRELLTAPAESSHQARLLAAEALAFANPERVPVKEFLQDLMRDSRADIAKAALRSIGRLRVDLAPLLLASLTNRATRVEAREALEKSGERVVPLLLYHLDDPNTPGELRGQLPRVLAAILGPRGVPILLERLPGSAAAMRFQVLRALNRIRREHPELEVSGEVVDAQIVDEARRYYELLFSIESSVAEDTDGKRLLIRSLEYRLDQTLERIFRLLGLRYPPDEIYDAYRAMRSPASQRRAAAVEFLDNLLDPPLKRMILPILEEHSWNRLEPLGAELFGLTPLRPEDCVAQLIRGDDPWLRVVGLYRAGEMQMHSLEPELRQAARDSDSLVAETATHAIGKLTQQAA
jgi:AAA family ATP:ADP antiporter